MESTGIFPTENEVTIINKKAQQLRDYDEVVVRNLQFFLPLQMDILVELRNRRRAVMDASAQNVSYAMLRFYIYLRESARLPRFWSTKR